MGNVVASHGSSRSRSSSSNNSKHNSIHDQQQQQQQNDSNHRRPSRNTKEENGTAGDTATAGGGVGFIVNENNSNGSSNSNSNILTNHAPGPNVSKHDDNENDNDNNDDHFYTRPAIRPSPPNSPYKESMKRIQSIHHGLVRERDTKIHDFDAIYEICCEIGQGGLCSIYKIRKKSDYIGGSSRPEHVRSRRRRRNKQSQHRIRRYTHLASLTRGFSSTPAQLPSLAIADIISGKTSLRQNASVHADLNPEPAGTAGGDDNNSADNNDSTDMYNEGSMVSQSEMCFALKVINLKLVKEDKINQLQNEVEILKGLDHKNIIKAYETFQMPKSKKLMIVMELCTGGDLSTRFPYTERKTCSIVNQVLSALSYMHDRKKIIHRDLKLENIMFESRHPHAAIKVIDFGLSKKYSEERKILTERVGTLYSMSPETMKGMYTDRADIWSLAVITYMLLSGGDKPFEGKTPKELIAKVLMGDYTFDSRDHDNNNRNNDNTNIDNTGAVVAAAATNVWDGISDSAKSFVRSLLVVNPAQRPSALQAMEHEWIRTYRDKMHRRNQQTTNNTSSETISDCQSVDSSDYEIGATETGSSSNDNDEDDQDVTTSSMRSIPQVDEELKQRVRENIIQYADAGEFRKLALNVIAKKSTCGEIFELRNIFDDFDAGNTGTITLDEFKEVLSQFHYSDEDLYQIFRKVDVNKTNVINYTEFLAAALETQGAIQEYRLAEAFDMLDTDDTGYISKENLRQVLGGQKSGVDEKYLNRLIEEAISANPNRPVKHKGEISYEDFLRVFSKDVIHEQVSEFYQAASRESTDTARKDSKKAGGKSPDDTGKRNDHEISTAAADEVLRRHGILEKTQKAILRGLSSVSSSFEKHEPSNHRHQGSSGSGTGTGVCRSAIRQQPPHRRGLAAPSLRTSSSSLKSTSTPST